MYEFYEAIRQVIIIIVPVLHFIRVAYNSISYVYVPCTDVAGIFNLVATYIIFTKHKFTVVN